MPRARSRIHRLYDALLRCYPAAFRDEYGRELSADFTRLWRDERSLGILARTRFIVSVLTDTIATAASEHAAILLQDLRTSVRSLLRAPAFALGGTITLALGIGAATAVFSVVHAVLRRPLPFPQPDTLVELVGTKPLEGIEAYSVSAPDFESWRERTHSFADMAALWSRSIVLTDGFEPEQIEGMAVSPNLWTLLGIDAIAGRTFDPARDSPDEKIALVSDGLLMRRYGGDRTLIGRSIHIGGEAHAVVGIVPSDLGFTRDVDVWLPWAANPRQSRGDRQADVIAVASGLHSRGSSVETLAPALQRRWPSRRWPGPA